MARYVTRMQKHRAKERKNIVIAIIFLMTIFMTLGYAAYQRELIIASVGKIYNDWDVRFTDAKCELYSDLADYECHAYGQLESDVDHLGKYKAGIEDLGDNLGGIVLNLYTEFATPEDYTEYEIEITNYSEMWDSLLTGISYDLDARKASGDYILYKIEGLEVDDGSGTLGTKLYTSNNLTEDNDITFKITAYWNPELYTSKPPGTIDKSLETGTEETYKEEKEIVLIWTAIAP